MTWIVSILVSLTILIIICGVIWLMVDLEYECGIPVIASMIVLGIFIIFVIAIHNILF